MITVSLGVATYPKHALTGDALLQIADKALYQAKINGRDRVVIVEESQ
jgi:diguanylate cyclase (GGDEF)-like protein